MKLFWGDLHNHCAISYGSSTLPRALANARAHLDFCTITGHAFWPDMPMDLKTQDGIIAMHLGGFEKLRHYWKEALLQMEAANEPGRFIVLPSYEWHSMAYGDYNCYLPQFDVPLVGAPTLPELITALEAEGRPFMLLPHHCGYPQGYRGTRWEAFDERVSPLAEIYSNHGCCEADDAPYEYHHSMGPRTGVSTLREALVQGKRFGFYASTDSHDGYPGHYGHGITAVQAEKLTLGEIWKALRERRTIAGTGARIGIAHRLGNTELGGIHPVGGTPPPWHLAVEGTAPLLRVDSIEGSDGEWSVRPLPLPPRRSTFRTGRYKVRIEAGWGRGAQLSRWEVDLRLLSGTLLGATPCFRHAAHPLAEEEATECLETIADNRLRWRCHAAPNPAGQMGGTHFHSGGTQSILLDLDANAATRLRLQYGSTTLELPFPDLCRRSFAQPAGSFGSSALKVHRASPEAEWTLTHEEAFTPTNAPGFRYIRVLQADGHVAWSSPIWWE
ncbi:MAG TPA: hypothetical protein VNQ90_17035 [Chthoniobacteraceae bacterium]|nr:hypothetical protein [Chthoniobacteraceae bacterium]